MLPSLRSTRRLAASLTLCCFVFGCHSIQAATPATAMDQSHQPEIITLEASATSSSQTLLAHHGGEGVGTGATGALGGAAAAPTVRKGRSSQSITSNSLWGNLLLSMAYQMDPELQKLATKIGRVNTFTLLSITGTSGLGLAQSIYDYRQIKPQSIDITPAHHPGGHDHVHIPAESTTVSTLGIIGSSVTLATLGINAVMNRHYSRQLTRKQMAIKDKVEHILTHLREGAETEHVQQELTTLVGPLATEEFLQLWRSTHQ